MGRLACCSTNDDLSRGRKKCNTLSGPLKRYKNQSQELDQDLLNQPRKIKITSQFKIDGSKDPTGVYQEGTYISSTVPHCHLRVKLDKMITTEKRGQMWAVDVDIMKEEYDRSGKHQNGIQKMAMKYIQYDDNETYQNLMKQFAIWEKVYHINILKIFKLFDDTKNKEIFLQMELAQQGPIQTSSIEYFQEEVSIRFQKNELMQDMAIYQQKSDKSIRSSQFETKTKWIFKQVAQGMQVLHDQYHIAFRNLKPSNILCGTKYGDPQNDDEHTPTIKLCDFSQAVEILPGQEQGFKVKEDTDGVYFLTAPELISDNTGLHCPKALDVWDFGITLYIYMENSIPFIEHQPFKKSELLNTLATSDLSGWIDQRYIEKECSEELLHLQKWCLSRDPSHRPTFQEILSHQWFQQDPITHIITQRKSEEQGI